MLIRIIFALLLATTVISIEFGIDINYYERWCFNDFIGIS
jgi:hypothetical protein